MVTVTLNAALDVTCVVARVLSALGQPTVVTGLCGGPTGRLLRNELRSAGLAEELVPVAGDLRRTLTVVSRDDGDATVFNQAGPLVQPPEWAEFTSRSVELVP
ncbi:1-phosphofructokinase family hexose kinase [Streptomyces luteolus]|uniref:1-phosphofructokinase n=1 Tax=Streptomyces luteolus TaxID=3043615 RepID=A0ABT6T1C3_9ACTN|nr:hypothetical protein [Streptomyces sp. B-S-A12]MDI3421654.1 hypothetical protein [Streptomyces sp. B-S-A12]